MTDVDDPSRRRVLVVTDSAAPRVDGIASSTGSMIRGLVEQKCAVAVIAPGRRRGGGTDALGAVRWDVRSIRTPVDGYPLSLASAAWIARRIREFEPDVISVQTIGPLGVAALRAADRTRTPVALSWHTDFEAYVEKYPLGWLFALPAALSVDDGHGRPSRREILSAVARREPHAFRKILTRGAGTADLLIVPSEKTAQYTDLLNIEAPVFVLPTGVEASEIGGETLPDDVRESVEGRPRGSRIVYVGRMSREKGIDFLMDAFGHVLTRRGDATLILVGPCKDRATGLRLDAARARFGPNLVVTGGVHRGALLDLYRRVDVFATASLTETQGIAAWEASLAGLPVVARDDALRGETPEVFEERQAGFHEPRGFGDGILRTLEREDPRAAGPRDHVGLPAAERARLFLEAVDLRSAADGGAPWVCPEGVWRPADRSVDPDTV
ncbi:glycosyltransferase [Planotetraspora kaengkrachanensis]|uniref:Glycosyl transferase n=1 Tax=Planotetraspora kaengkrachanensis TaxID=575193 RepID=A0A8J3PUS0_9ACTN|nr:glycosyltransferase [Planotetraspora kaengkrachanensis]GIG81410.1 glycosyl transferase [Planotetraspora kaengkrachanensis]